MTVDRGRIDRGKQSQLIVASWFAVTGWPYAEAVGNGRMGTDVTGMPGLLVETKAERGWRPTTWLRQHDLPPIDMAAPPNRPPLRMFAVQRPDGYGPGTISAWPVIMRLDSFTCLLREAGYGTGERE